MKEAAGEANLTVIAILLIGVVAAVVTPIINSTMQSTAKKSCCSNYGGVWKSNQCYSVSSTGAVSSSPIPETTYWNSTEKTCN